MTTQSDADLLAAFWAHVDASAGVNACWPWTGNRRPPDSYGRFRSNGRIYYAHRVSLAIALGREIGKGLFACHHCDNPPCVNPAHLFEGTAGDNLRDCRAKGRWNQFRLTASQIEAVRADDGPAVEVARRHGVAIRTVYRLRANPDYGQIVLVSARAQQARAEYMALTTPDPAA